MIAIAFLVVPAGKEVFRQPKAVVLHIAAFLALVIFAIDWLKTGFLPSRLLGSRAATVMALGIAWATVTSLLSTNGWISAAATLHFALSIVYFVAARAAAEVSSRKIALILVASAAINAGIGILQHRAVWFPLALPSELSPRMRTIGMLGNPNDLAGFLVPSLVLTLALAGISRGPARWTLLGVALLVGAGIGATESTTGLSAVLGGTVVLVVRTSRRFRVRAWTAVGSLVAAGVVVLVFQQDRVGRKLDSLSDGTFQEAASGRLLAWATAWMMTEDNLVFGVGPGCFGWQYIDYQAAAQSRFPHIAVPKWRVHSFNEVHNDYLEIASETGIPGLLIFLSGLVVLVRRTRRSGADAPVWPGTPELLATLLVQMMTNFPLQIPAVLAAYLYAGGVLLKWRSE